jgi:hypothetical protein
VNEAVGVTDAANREAARFAGDRAIIRRGVAQAIGLLETSKSRAASGPAFSLSPDQAYPVCVAFSGDSPVEYPDEDEPEEPESFSLAEVNAALTAAQ